MFTCVILRVCCGFYSMEQSFIFMAVKALRMLFECLSSHFQTHYALTGVLYLMAVGFLCVLQQSDYE